ncbi:hypothetical protein GFS24_24270 [Chitinophaga sp. SYP-B3965]|uniref:hypothetical protein n=1 Tax=Chitinophaga sp. SYP-B3965 TaxID=2663120 RepID=UPI0012999AFD|nr:hypothetical protein [Chitinophaga sp. SYP-B3965]MRG48258.1 hypothetical protein [Chitinophaga sp. SYP-B3965]
MAMLTDNLLLKGASGTFGKQFVFRQRNGKTVICKMPKPYEKPPTDKQLANRERFSRANTYAKAAIADPVKKQYYLAMAKPGHSAYNVAFREAFHGPEITKVSVEAGIVTIQVKDSYIVDNVKVESSGQIRPATPGKNRREWEYKLRSSEKIIRILAYDRTGNVNTKDILC